MRNNKFPLDIPAPDRLLDYVPEPLKETLLYLYHEGFEGYEKSWKSNPKTNFEPFIRVRYPEVSNRSNEPIGKQLCRERTVAWSPRRWFTVTR